MKKTMKNRLAAAGLCLVLTAGMLTGCGNADQAIITLDGQKTEYAVANIMLRYSQAQMQAYYGAYMGDSLWTQYGDSTKTSMMSTLKQMLILEQHQDEYNVSLTDDEKSKIDAAAQQFMDDNDQATIKAMGATKERVARVLELYTIRSKMSNAIVADVDTNVTDEEAAQKTIQYVVFSTADTTDSDGKSVALTDDEKAALLENANKVRDAVAGGKTLEDAVKEVDDSKTVSSASYGDNDESYTLDESIRTVADKLKDGEVAGEVVANDTGYYVVQMKATYDADATASKKERIINERKSSKFSEVYDAWESAADYTEDANLLKQITFKDIYEIATEAQSETAAESTETTEAAGTENTSETTVTETESAAETAAESESAAE